MVEKYEMHALNNQTIPIFSYDQYFFSVVEENP